MGNSNSQLKHQQLFKSFNRSDWKVLSNTGLYQIWQNTLTNNICQAYKLDYVPDQKILQQYRFRHDNQKASYFVSIKHVSIVQDKFLCSKGQSYVLTQYIPVKLYDMKNLNISEGYSLLRSSYCAFNTIQAFHGSFSPQEQLIGVNLQGKPKIWVNKDHSKGSSTTKNNAKVCQNIRKILEMIQQKLQAKQFPNEFRSYFYDNVLNFFQAYQFVQQFCQKKQINIPNQIQYIKHIQDQNIYHIVDQYLKNNDKKNLSQISSAKILPQRIETESSYQRNISQNRFSKVIIQNKLFQKPYTTMHKVNALPIITPLNEKSIQKQKIVINNRVSQVKFRSNSPNIVQNSIKVIHKPITQVVINNVKIESPKKLSQTRQTVRPLGTKLIYSPSSKQLITIAQSKYCGQAGNKQVISQTIISQQNNKQVYLNNSPQNLRRSIHQKFLSNIEQQSSQERTQQKGEFSKYINQESQNEQIQNQEKQLVSEPDWQNLNQQNQQNQQLNYQDQEQHISDDGLNSEEQRYHHNYCQDQSVHSLHRQVQNYVQQQFLASPQKQKLTVVQKENQEQPQVHREEYEYKIYTSNHMSNHYEQNVQSSFNNNQQKYFIENQYNNSNSYYQNNNKSQQLNYQQQLDSYQKSSGTLVIHESQQNIYNQVNRRQSVIQRQHLVQSQGNITEVSQMPYRSKILEMQKLRVQIQIQVPNNNQTNFLTELTNKNKYTGLHFRNQSDQFYLYKPSQPIYNQQQFIQNIQRNTTGSDITKLQSQKQIQDYIKDKYSHMFIKHNAKQIQGIMQNKIQSQFPERRRSSRQDRTMTFAKNIQLQMKNYEYNINKPFANKDYSEVEKYNYNFNNNITQSISMSRPASKNNYKKQVQKIMGNFQSQYYEPVEKVYPLVYDDIQKASSKDIGQVQSDFLDVKNLQKNLDKKYKNSDSKSHSKNKSSSSTPFSEEDGINIALLDQKLQKFQETRQNQDKKLFKIQELNVVQNLQKFSQFDNFVQMMDKKIQQSQSRARITSSRSGTNTDLPPKPAKNQRINQTTPINSIPVLKRDSKKTNALDIALNLKQNYSQDNFNILSSQRDRQRSQRLQANQYKDQKQNFQINGYTFSKKTLQSVQGQNQINLNAESKRRVSKRLSAVQDAKKLAQQMQKKYQRHINKTSQFDTNENDSLFKKKRDSYKLESLSNHSNRLIDIEHKRTSRLQPIIQLNGQISPYKAPTIRNQNQNNSNYSKQQNFDTYKALTSNKSSNQGSMQNLRNNNSKRVSKVSYQQLRDLLWN